MSSESTLGRRAYCVHSTVICAGVQVKSFVTDDRGGFHVNLSGATTETLQLITGYSSLYMKMHGPKRGRLMPDVHGYTAGTWRSRSRNLLACNRNPATFSTL